MAGYSQNLEPQGLTAKILWNKDLAADEKPLMGSVVEDLFGELSRIGQSCSFQNSR
jgi:hypothetical protein